MKYEKSIALTMEQVLDIEDKYLAAINRNMYGGSVLISAEELSDLIRSAKVCAKLELKLMGENGK